MEGWRALQTYSRRKLRRRSGTSLRALNFRLCGKGLLVLEPRLPTRGGASTRCAHCSWEGRGAEGAGPVILTAISYHL